MYTVNQKGGESMKKDLTIRDVARITGLRDKTLRQLAARGELVGAYRLGHKWLINRDQFEQHRGNGVDFTKKVEMNKTGTAPCH